MAANVKFRTPQTSVTWDDLQNLHWKCGSCSEWHHGPCLDFHYTAPYYWSKEHDGANYQPSPRLDSADIPKTFLDEEFCAIDGHAFFVRGIIHVPIVGTAETLRWGVWGSISREDFRTLWRINDRPRRVELRPMLSYLSTQIPEYPDTLDLKMYVHIDKAGECPKFVLEPSDHPLALEYQEGITPQRAKQIIIPRVASIGAGHDVDAKGETEHFHCSPVTANRSDEG